MAGPYLKSGESIILTTDRVLIDDIEYDLILTSQRLALVDSGHTSDQPQVVPFATILSVKGGTTPAREPIITITTIDPIGLEDSKALDLIFSQQPYEDRAAECDLWIQKLIEHIVSVRQEPASAGKQQVSVKSHGLHPTVRRFEAPEMPRPHSQVARKNSRPSEELLSALQGSSWETPDEAAEEPAPDDQQSPDQDNEPQAPAYAFEEEGISSPASLAPVDLTHADSPEENADVHDEAIPGAASPGASVQDEEPVITPTRPDQVVVPAALFEEPVLGAGEGKPGSSVPAQPDEGPVEEEHQEAGAMVGPANEVETPVPVPPGPPAGAAPDHMDDTGIPRPEPGAQTGLPDTVVFPVISDASLSAVPETPPAETPPTVQVPARQPPAPQPGRIPVRVMAVIILVILAVIGGAVIILLHPAGNTGGPDHPAITPIQTLLPITTTVPVVIPTDGVWVKVTYNGTFVGTYGNPGDLREVRGTGEQVYAIKNTNDLVQALFTKQDDYGDILTVEVYNNGTRVTQVTKRTPGGTIAILVDPKTGKAPYVPVTTARK